MQAYYKFADENGDGLMDCVMVLSRDYTEPLIGDYRGVRLAVIPFSNDEGKVRAELLAKIYCAALINLNIPTYQRAGLSEKTNQEIIDLICEHILPEIEVGSLRHHLMTEVIKRLEAAGLPDSIQEALNSGDGVRRP